MPGSSTNILFYIVIIALVIFRSSRPQRISITRMWISPILLMLLAAFAIYGGQQMHPASALQIALAVVLGLAAGIPVGILRGHHTQVSATAKHGVMQLGPSWQTAAIYIVAFGARFAIRMLVPATSAVGAIVSDGLLVFAIAIIGTTYYAVYRKYEALDRAMPA